ncbi:paternally-expressed protein 3 -like [Brachionus plicatilis]|uniref:Paternally-expressed protein 3-like n=1 Tax=Brachionus plicatilis TaxID=10195 RepID=A0A3M7QRN4_BRAPC|nr:paternally-expressed protein 3 -like [Brachionus plicatilis]
MYFKGFVIWMTIELVCSYPYRTLNEVEYNRRYIPKLLNAKDENGVLIQPQIFEKDVSQEKSFSEKPAKYSAQHFDQNQQHLFMNDYNKASTEEQAFDSDSIKPQAQQHYSYDMDLNRDVDERKYHIYESFMNPSQLKSDERNYNNDQSQRQPSDRVSFRYPTRNEYYGDDDKKVLTQQYLEQAQQGLFDNSQSRAQSASEQYYRYPTQIFTNSDSLKQHAQKQQAFEMDLNRDVDEKQYHSYESFKNPYQLKSDEGNYKNDQSQRQLLAEESSQYIPPKEALNKDLDKAQDLRKYYGSSPVNQNLIEPQKHFLPEKSYGYSSQDQQMKPSLLQNEKQKYAFAKDLIKANDQNQINIESSGNQVQQKTYQRGSDESFKYQTDIYPESSWYSAQKMIDRMKKSQMNQSPKSSAITENNVMNGGAEQKKFENSFTTNNMQSPHLSESFISPAYMQLDSLDLFNSLAQQNSGILSSIPEKSFKIQQSQHNPVQHSKYRTKIKQQPSQVPVQQSKQDSVPHPSYSTQERQQPDHVPVHQQPQQSSVHQQPQQSSVHHQPLQSSVHQQPQQSSVHQQPEHIQVPDPSYSKQVKQQPDHVQIHQQPQQSSVYHQPLQSSVHQQPQQSSVHQQPEHIQVPHPSYSKQVKQQPDHVQVHQQPQQSSVHQQPQQSSVNQQPEHIQVPHPSYSKQVKQQPDHVPVHQQPQQSSVHQQPEHIQVPHPSYSKQVKQQPDHVQIHQQPQQSSVYHQPLQSSVHQQPQQSSVNQQPEHIQVPHPSYSKQVKQQPDHVQVHQQPQQSSVHQQPQQSLGYQHPQHIPVQYPSYSTQVNQPLDHAPVYQYPSYSTNVQKQSQHGTVYHQPQYSSVQQPSYSTQVQKQSNHVPTHQPNSYNISAYLFFPNNAYISKA